MTETDCAFTGSDTPSRYVAKRLSSAEAETFEEHYFSCAQCWQEVQTGTAARALLTAPRQTRWWMTLAAAVVIGLLALVGIRERVVRENPDVLRGGTEHSITVVAERAEAQLQIRWRAVARASRYDVALRSAEGEVLQQKSSAATTLVFDGVSSGEVFIRVTAFDSQGEELARSPLVRVPPR